MKYYKIIMDNKFIGVGTTIDLRRFQEKHQIFLSCNESKAQYIQCDGKLYRAMWMCPEGLIKWSAEAANVVEIPQTEYETLFQAIKSNEEIQIAEEPEVEEELQDNVSEDEKLTIDYIRDAKIKEMKSACNKAITTGFDIELSDGKKHHFSLTVQDQLNLITAFQMLSDGTESIPYHADGELCKYYTAIDMLKVIEYSNLFKTYHVAYFNSLKAYIASLQDEQQIAALSYGGDVPIKYRSEVYNTLKSEL